MESQSAEGNFDQHCWVIQIREWLEHVEEEETPELCSVSVFNVPKELLAMKPEAYIPQAISIGPYYHCRSELYGTERYKVAAARKAQEKLKRGLKFDSVVEEFQKLDWQVRSCYHKYVAYDRETLAWLMALDASFVLECLEFYVDTRELEGEFGKRVGPVFHPKDGSVDHKAIVRDMMMLENQIPLFLLEKLLEMQFDSKHKAEERLCILANRVCREISPFRFGLPQISTRNVKERAHLLELLYHALAPISSSDVCRTAGEENESTPPLESERPALESEHVKEDLSSLWKVISSLNVGPVRKLAQFSQRVLRAKPVELIMKLPWRSVSPLVNSVVLPMCKGSLRFIFNFITCAFCKVNADTNSKDKAPGSPTQSAIPPSRYELVIPSISELHYAGVKFAPSDGDLTTIRFEKKTVTLYLPALVLDTNTEVILRNLAAFEACAAAGPLLFTRYIDFMNGMIDTEEDVRLLRRSGIIYSHLRNDQDVANLWNSMGKCARLSGVQQLDNVIADVNKYYRSRWCVAAAEYVNKYIFRSWKWLSLLAAVLLLVFTCLQAFCSVYECKKGISNLLG